MPGIYFHIPFCRQACHYCDFHFSTNTQTMEAMVRCLADEIALRKTYLTDEPVQTIYFGGGTPSLLRTADVSRLLDAVWKHHRVAGGAEITIEANPDDITAALLKDLKSIGINRLSIGVQSFDDTILRYLNRAHDSRAAMRSVELARKEGFDNISIDLIYAIPGTTESSWQRELAQALALEPPHISAYSLTIEEKTVFGHRLKKGVLQPIDEALAASQLRMLMNTLSAAGYVQYEISNFAREGWRSRHNSSYWKGEPYLGIGPSAHSFDRTSRQHNVANNARYIRSITEGIVPFEREILTRTDRVNEYILTGLRTDAGCHLPQLAQQFGYDLAATHPEYLRQLSDKGLIAIEDNTLRLTAEGRLLADRICSDLFLTE